MAGVQKLNQLTNSADTMVDFHIYIHATVGVPTHLHTFLTVS